MNQRSELSELKRGYLKSDFAFFHLKDQRNIQFENHYHDFNKIIIFISGNVSYLIEGKVYKLKPWDILLVGGSEIHKPVIDPGSVYERIVIWINQSFLDKHSTDDCNLSTCFELAAKTNFNLVRMSPESIKSTRLNLAQLEEAYRSNEFGSRILSNACFMQLIVHINREFSGTFRLQYTCEIEYDERINSIIGFINGNLDGDLSIESLSAKFFVSKYYLMHRFKSQTGYSIHSYILQKRLTAANTMLKAGRPAIQVCEECGFGDYSSFVRSFKKMFGLSPKNHYKKLMQLKKEYGSGRHF